MTSWRSAWRSLRKAAGLPQVRFHDGRHTALTRLAERGVPDWVTITTETAEEAEALVFKVRKNQGAGIAAKMTFAVKRAKPTQPVPIS
jgi:integrase